MRKIKTQLRARWKKAGGTKIVVEMGLRDTCKMKREERCGSWMASIEQENL